MSSEQGLHEVFHSLATSCLPTEHTALSCGSQEEQRVLGASYLAYACPLRLRQGYHPWLGHLLPSLSLPEVLVQVLLFF